MSAYEIFKNDPALGILWTGEAESIPAAHEKMKTLPAGNYFVFDHHTQQRIPRVTESSEVKGID